MLGGGSAVTWGNAAGSSRGMSSSTLPCGAALSLLPPPEIHLIPQRIGSTARGPSGRESWTRRICWSLGRAAPARAGLCQKDPQSQTEAELASNFKAVWRTLIVQIHCSRCGSLPNPRGEGIFGEGKREQGKAVTEIFSVPLESILAGMNSLIYVGKNLIRFTHFLPCANENTKPTSTH